MGGPVTVEVLICVVFSIFLPHSLMFKYHFWSYEKWSKICKCVRICVDKSNNFYAINYIGHTLKFVLNPRWDILYQNYKKERKCADR